jgi:hypothetical protein
LEKNSCKIVIVIGFLISMTQFTFSQWIPTNGWGNGTIRSFLVNETTLFAGTDGGVYQSTNNGTHWTQTISGMNAITHVYCLAVNGNNLFAATDKGVFRSVDNGINWSETNTGLPENTSVNALATSGPNLFAGANGGVFLSTNDGKTWVITDSSSFKSHSWWTMGSSGQVYALAVKGKSIFAGTEGGFFLSSNDGASWESLDSGLISVGIYSLLTKGELLFAGTSQGIFISTNSGTCWTNVYAGIRCNTLAADGNILLAGTSVDISAPSGHTHGGGVIFSDDNGAHWTKATDGLPDLPVISLVVSGTNIFAGTDGGGCYLSTNHGIHWIEANSGLLSNSIANLKFKNSGVISLAVSGTNIFAGLSDGGCYISTNNGEDWQEIDSGFPANTVFTSLTASGTDLFAVTSIANAFTTYSIFFSTNNGNTWQRINSGLPTDLSVNSLAASGKNIFALTNKGIYLSTNNGPTWTAVNSGLPRNDTLAPYYWVRSISVNETNIIAGIEEINDTGPNSYSIYHSLNCGTTWTIAVPESSVNYTITSLAAIGTKLFIGTDVLTVTEKDSGGVYYSTNNGTSWTKINNGLPVTNWGRYPPIRSLAITETNLFAGTSGTCTGVWRLPLSQAIGTNKSKSLLQKKIDMEIQPPLRNNSTLSIEFMNTHFGLVTIKIFNVSGCYIETLANNWMDKGRQRVTWNTRQMATGFYMVKIQTGASIQIKRIPIWR